MKVDSVLKRIFTEVAEEFNIRPKDVEDLYNYYYLYIYRRVVRDRMRYLTKKTQIARAENVRIPILGRLLNIYGKTLINKKDGKKENGSSSKKNNRRT